MRTKTVNTLNGVEVGGLVVTRKLNESVVIGEHVRVTVVMCRSGKTRIRIDAPKTMPIVRSELLETTKV